MNYPLISEYIEAIKLAEDNFEELNYLRPVLGDDGLLVMTSGNFAVVFKMKDEQSGKLYAVKCFTKEQEGRAEAYREIAKELEFVSSPYILSIQYLDKELFVDTDQTTETEFPILLMDWVEGKTLDKYLRENLDDKYALEMLAYRFSQLAQWLIPQPFAHGDLKPDNILVREDGSLVLVDYDGMYVPAMKGQKARELGSPDFRHPLRTENDFDEHIDDFPLVSILLSLKAISLKPQWLNEFGASDRLLFSEQDYSDINRCDFIKNVFPHTCKEINNYICLLVLIINEGSKQLILPNLINVARPSINGIPVSSKILDIATEMSYLLVKNNLYITYEQYEEIMLNSLGDDVKTLLYHLYSVAKKIVRQKQYGEKLLTLDYCNSEENVDKDGANYSKDGLRLFGFFSDSNTGIYRIKEGTLAICDLAFNIFENDNHYLKGVYIPSSVIAIGNNPFAGCVDFTIYCESPFFKIENGLLYDCFYERLIANTNSIEVLIELRSNVRVIGAYSLCYGRAKSVSIPEHVVTVEEFAFAYSEIECLIIPSSTYRIERQAFIHCKNLKDIVILGGDTEIDVTAFDDCNNLRHLFVLTSRINYYHRLFPNIADKFVGIGNYDDVFVGQDCFADELFNMGNKYENGYDIVEDYKEAIRLYNLAIQMGHKEALIKSINWNYAKNRKNVDN